MKILTLTMIVLATTMVAETSFAEENQGPGQRRQRGAQANGQQRQGPGGQQRQGPGGQRGGDRDPATMVARLMEQFDKNGDKKLDMTELTAMMTSMRERGGAQRGQGQGRGQGAAGQGRGQRPGGQGGAGQGGAGQGKGQRQGRGPDGDAAAGGKRPKRPDAE
ncbi:MAG: hypothetical protein ACR2NZ_03650 [Rubripirellula sp.]